MATLVERTSRYTVPVALPAGRRDASTTCHALIGAVTGMPAQLTKTLTWDQGSEMAAHTALHLATTMDMFFAHPHSPWERGTNENTHRLLREYLPMDGGALCRAAHGQADHQRGGSPRDQACPLLGHVAVPRTARVSEIRRLVAGALYGGALYGGAERSSPRRLGALVNSSDAGDLRDDADPNDRGTGQRGAAIASHRGHRVVDRSRG